MRSINIKRIACIALCCVVALLGNAQQTNTTMEVDHRYSIPWWQTLICLPDDPVKTLVGREGQLFGDYGYSKGIRDFSFAVQFDGKTPASWQKQTLAAASVPITETSKQSGSISIKEQTFLEIPEAAAMYSIVRYDSRRVSDTLLPPVVKADPCFNVAAEGVKGLSGEGLIEFHIKVHPGESNKVALGFCENKWKTAGQRVMRVYVEGAPQKDIDPVKDFGYLAPGVYTFDSRDADQDGTLTIVVSNMPGAQDRNTIVNGLWLFKGQLPAANDIISGAQNRNALLYAVCAKVGMPERRYHTLVTLHNNAAESKTFYPVVHYTGIDAVYLENQYVQFDAYTRLAGSVAIDRVIKDSPHHYTIHLAPVQLKGGEQKQLALTLSRFFAPSLSYKPTVAKTLTEQQKAKDWWLHNSPAAAAITVPDKGIQDMVTSSLRNIFQARDIRKGNKSFHVGPTIYRGLWLADGSFLLEVATMLGYIKDVRSCIDYLTHFQLKDGGFEMITTFHKENGLVPFMLIRHAMLTQDKKWLEENWSVVEGCLKRIAWLRAEAMKDSTKPYYTLLPDGNIDGGIQHGNDYSNTEWCLSGMKWAIHAARWLGKNEQAAQWQKDYDSFYASFIRKAGKDIRKDEKGNTYLPVMINNEQNQDAQRGQWAFCQSVYPGQVFDDNPQVKEWAAETVDMLTDHREEGLVFNTGWMKDGIWTYFASFYGHAMQWLGKTQGIPQLLYDYANHSSPTMVWREEQKPQGKGNEEVGDMPHNWASAEFIRMVVHMIELDRGNELHLFEALPKQWAKAGAVTKLNGIRTPFGAINLQLAINAAGNKATVDLRFPDKEHLPAKVVIHGETWTNNVKQQVVPVKEHITETMNID